MITPTLPVDEVNPKAYTTLNIPTILSSSCYTSETLSTLFKDPYARCGWIIPVRGTPPFPDCTSASVIAQPPTETSSEQVCGDAVLPRGPTLDVAHKDSLGCIIWTADALQEFWKFLIAVREAGKMGPIGLSFYCTNPYNTSPFPFSNNTVAGQVLSQQNRSRDYSSKSQPQETTSDSRNVVASSLRDVDYVKIYVDAPYAPKMRDVLHAWGYECEGAGRDLRRTKVRMFKGAKFVLVDERSKGVLVW